MTIIGKTVEEAEQDYPELTFLECDRDGGWHKRVVPDDKRTEPWKIDRICHEPKPTGGEIGVILDSTHEGRKRKAKRRPR